MPEIRSAFRRGIVLFNAGRFFDAHEALEDAWRESARGSALRRHLQGMVQVAVALHHQSRDNFTGARSVLDRALRNLGGAEDSFPDLELDRLRADLADWQRYLAGTRSERPASGGAPHRTPSRSRAQVSFAISLASVSCMPCLIHSLCGISQCEALTDAVTHWS